ncbi:MAG: gas vesicle protein GvpN [Planctomycetota bacterium]
MTNVESESAVRRTHAIEFEASEDFVLTAEVQAITERALAYLAAGYGIHLAGPAGTGKTTLAFHIAAQLGNPITLVHGNDEFGSSDLVGRDTGYARSSVVDNFIHSVLKTEERVDIAWSDNRLTTCCEQGHTLVYDEFNRTSPEANNILLSVLEEGILDLPRSDGGEQYLEVHPNFRCILTSNPEEYAGVHRTQDALLDRVVTLDVGHYDEETETRITAAKSNLDLVDAATIVELVRTMRQVGESPTRPTIRAAIAIARVCAARGASIDAHDRFFRAVCHDVLLGALRTGGSGRGVTAKKLDELIDLVRQARAVAPPKRLERTEARDAAA